MNDLHRLFPRSLSDPISEGSVDSAGGGTRLLAHALMDAEHRLLRNDWNDGVQALCECFYVAAVHGPGRLSTVELQQWMERIYEAGKLPDGLDAA